MATEDPSIFAHLLDKAWAVVGVLLGVVWKDHDSKLKETAERLDKKADKDDLKHALEHIEKLYLRAEEDREKVRERSERNMTQMIQMRKEIIDELRRGNGT